MLGARQVRARAARFDLPGQVDTFARRELATTVAGLLVACGALLAGVDAIAPPMSAWWLLATIGGIGLVGLLMSLGLLGAWSPTQLTMGVFSLQAVMTLLLIASGSNDGNTRLFFVWLTPYAAFFLGRRVAAAFVGWVAVLLMLGLLVTGDSAWRIGLAWASTIALMVSITLFVLWSSAMLRSLQTKAHVEARRDPLTGLANRAAWNSSVSRSLEGLEAAGGRLIALLIDLDDFKGINDTYGHAAGDALLRQVAPRLQGAVRPEDTVARLGGDEFALLCSDPALALDPDELVERIRSALGRPYILAGGEQVYPGASIGVVVASDPMSADDLLTRADIAMYRAKAAGRNQAMRFDDSMARESAERHELVTALHRALDLEQCQVVYQAAYDLAEHRLIGAEALLRWNHPTLGPVSPDRFIPLAEATGQVSALTDFVLGESLAMLASWRETGWVDEGFTLSVNVSVRDVRHGFADRILALLARTHIPPTCLAVELTETALMDEAADIDELRSLREAGVWVILDDFGSGYSSLAYLERLPLDGIKMDREFLPTADSNRRWEIVAAILEMARALHLHVVAEGVETEEQAEQLRRLGCRMVQGYLFASPVPAADFGISRPRFEAFLPAELS